MNKFSDHPEVARTQRLFDDAICGMEVEGGDIRVFAHAMLRASAEMYAEVFGAKALTVACSKLSAAQEMARGNAGRA